MAQGVPEFAKAYFQIGNIQAAIYGLWVRISIMLDRRWFLSGLAFSSLGHGAFASSNSTLILNQLEKFNDNILFMRHTLAPGFGDPDAFDITQCSTQRNLDTWGRAQAIELGQAFEKSGVKFDAIFSSQWCRCMETAKLLSLGPVQAFSGLNSFFHGYANRNETLQKLEWRISSFNPEALHLMLTHQVSIKAVSQLNVSSGEWAAYNFQTKRAVKLQTSWKSPRFSRFLNELSNNELYIISYEKLRNEKTKFLRQKWFH